RVRSAPSQGGSPFGRRNGLDANALNSECRARRHYFEVPRVYPRFRPAPPRTVGWARLSSRPFGQIDSAGLKDHSDFGHDRRDDYRPALSKAPGFGGGCRGAAEVQRYTIRSRSRRSRGIIGGRQAPDYWDHRVVPGGKPRSNSLEACKLAIRRYLES